MSFEQPLRRLFEGIGNINYQRPTSASGLLGLLTEESGIQLDNLGASIGIKNRLLWFFVQQFGAKGDGITDDTAAIQAAFTAAGASGQPGSVVYFSPGTYLVSATINGPVGHSVWVFGCGDGSTTVIQMTTDHICLNLHGNASKVTDLSFTYAGPMPPAIAEAIHFDDFDLNVRNCNFTKWFNCLVQTRQTASFIEYCGFVDYVNAGILTSNSINPDQGDGLIFACVFENPTVFGQFSIFNQGSGGQRILSCKFLGPVTHVIFFSLLAGQQTTDYLICNCSIEHFSVSGIIMSIFGAFGNVTIVNNQILSTGGGNGINVNVNGAGVIKAVTITANIITACQSGIQISGATNVKIVANAYDANVADVTRIGTTQVDFGLAGDDNAAAPATAVGVPAAVVYGSNAATLTTPNKWTAVVINNIVYKIPLYL
jgi:Pectate lyase superfamily protein